MGCADLLGDPSEFVEVGLEKVFLDLGVLGRAGGGEDFGDAFEAVFEAVLGLDDDFAHEVEDGLVAAVVLVEDDDGGVAVFLMEGEDVFDVGALEFEDGLVVVADGEDVWAAFVDFGVEDGVEEFELDAGGVLEFVDEEVLVFFLEVVAQFGVLFGGV